MDIIELDVTNIIIALQKSGFECNGKLAQKLWSRFSQDQCATWMEINDEEIERFVTWIDSSLDRDEAFS